MKTCVTVVAAWCIWAIGESVPGADQEAQTLLLAKFKEGAEREWPEFVKQYSVINRVVFTQRGRGKQIQENREASETMSVEVIRDGDQYVTTTTMEGRDLGPASEELKKAYRARIANGFCGDYGFSIMDADRNDSWSIRRVGKEQPPTGTLVPLVDGGVYLPALEVPFTCLAPSAGYAVPIYAEEIEKGGKHLLRVEFKWTGKAYQEKPGQRPGVEDFESAKSTKVTFDPEQRWLPVRAELTTEQRGTTTTAISDYSYDYSPTRVYGLRNQEKSISSAAVQGVVSIAIEFDEVRNPKNRFRLSYYGLPEPGFLDQPGGHRWVWIMLNLFGILLIVSAMCWRHFSKRHQHRA